MQYPIQALIPDVLAALSNRNTLIVQAPPGAGKSTILPLALLEAEWLEGQRILMLEPRRLAARSVATRMAQLHKDPLGQTVGYSVRFERKTSKQTRLEVVTDGILTRRLQQDSALEGVGLVIFDEFHERSLQADLGLALCRELQQVLRPELRLLIMSATLDGQGLAQRLGGTDPVPLLTSQGRQHPVSVQYEEPDSRLFTGGQVAKAVRKALREHAGDVLAFLPGTADIHQAADLLTAELPPEIAIHPLYGDLPAERQQAAILPDPTGRRKVILATSIAETSLTIEGVQVVIDSGLARVSKFDPRTGLSRLENRRVTLEEADQRAGRAGRLGPGHCIRLWPAHQQHQLAPHRTPEIAEADMAPLLLELSGWGIKNPAELFWLTPPPTATLAQASDLLMQLDAVSDTGQVTPKGRQMLGLPIHPRLAHLLIESREHRQVSLACDLAALLEERDPFPQSGSADLLMRLEALRSWRKGGSAQGADPNTLRRVERLSHMWHQLMKATPDNTLPDPFQVGWLVAMAYPERVAKKAELPGQPATASRYQFANGKIARLPAQDHLLMREQWLAVAHTDAGQQEGRIFLAAPVRPADLADRTEKQKVVYWDRQKDALVAQWQVRLGQLVVSAQPLTEEATPEKLQALLQVLQTDGDRLLNWSDEALAWMARIGSLRCWRPSEEWPDAEKKALLSRAEEWLSEPLMGVKKADDFKKIRLETYLPALLDWQQTQAAERLAPLRMAVPSGSQIRLEYQPDGRPPVLAARLQELFGLLETPRINEGRTPVLIHLLSPGYKPVQVTQDLKSFWQNTYPEVRKELRMRYPKHFWPEDPWTAEAVRGVKRK